MRTLGIVSVVVVVLVIGCGKSSSPTAPTPTPTKVIGLSGNLAFGNVPVGTTSDASLRITNSGTAALTVSSMTGPSGYTASWTSGMIAAGGSQDVTVRFAPTAAQTYSGTVTVNADHTSGTNTMAISGTGTGPVVASITATASPSSVVATCVTTGSLCAATVSIAIRESAGVGANVDFINSSFRNTAGTVADTANYTAAKIITLAGTNRVAPNGVLTIPIPGTQERIGNLWSQAGGVGRVGVLAITLQLTDDRGNVSTVVVNVPVS